MRRTMLGFGGLAGIALFGAIVRLSTGCADEGVTAFGNPNTLDRKNLPGEGGAAPLSCGGDAGAGKFDGGCPSFATDIYPYFIQTGKWKCSTPACHGGASKPDIKGDNAAACLADMRNVTVLGKPYITSEAGAGDPSATTTFLCNLQGSCGSRMPKAPGLDPTSDELCVVDAWLRCGSPR